MKYEVIFYFFPLQFVRNESLRIVYMLKEKRLELLKGP